MKKIVPRIEEVFAPQDRHIIFYETLFSPDGVKDLCTFLGLTYKDVDFEKRINASPRPAEPEAWARQQVRAAYDDTYEYCAKKFGRALISSLWNV